MQFVLAGGTPVADAFGFLFFFGQKSKIGWEGRGEGGLRWCLSGGFDQERVVQGRFWWLNKVVM